MDNQKHDTTEEFCAPGADGCLRCQAAPLARCPAGSALLLGPQDANVAATLRGVLDAAAISYEALEPLLIVPGARPRLGELAGLLSSRLSPYTQACTRAAYAPGGAQNPEQILAALLFAEPLPALLKHMEYEWVRDALRDGWLFSVFHPIVDAHTGATFGQEALIRARDPHTEQIIGAGPIITACEQLNLQHQLDQRARQVAIRGAAALGLGAAKVFINFLPNTIYDPEICLRTTMEAAEASRMPLDRLVFEVVETEHIPDMARLRHILDYYRARGVGTAVDDMGAGYSSLEYLTALHPDFVKLDREVVVDAEHDTSARRKLEEIVDAAQKLRIGVIAEGIETGEQMRMCVEAGVDYLQGFLFARPACPPQTVAFPQPQRKAA